MPANLVAVVVARVPIVEDPVMIHPHADMQATVVCAPKVTVAKANALSSVEVVVTQVVMMLWEIIFQSSQITQGLLAL